MVLLTEAGRAVMKAERPARLLLPLAAAARAARPRRRRGRAAPRAAGTTRWTRAASALFEALRAAPIALAREQGVPPYVVASDRTLREIAILRPRTPGSLMACTAWAP